MRIRTIVTHRTWATSALGVIPNLIPEYDRKMSGLVTFVTQGVTTVAWALPKTDKPRSRHLA